MCLVVKGAQVLAEEEERETSFSSHCWALQLIQPRPSHLASELRAALSLSQHPTSLACLLLAWEEARREGDAGQPQDSGDRGYHSVNKPEAMPSSSLSTCFQATVFQNHASVMFPGHRVPEPRLSQVPRAHYSTI